MAGSLKWVSFTSPPDTVTGEGCPEPTAGDCFPELMRKLGFVSKFTQPPEKDG